MGSGADRASDALYYMILKAVRALAFRLRGRRIRGMADPVAVFRKVKNLASPRGSLEDDLLGLAPVAVFPGPFHLASLLVAIGEALLEDAVVNVAPPSSVDPARWQRSMQAIAKDRPYLWANHQDAIKKGCLEPGVSSVISFPTGAGKSIVSELKIRATLLAGRKAVCLAPTHALVDQTARDLRAAFPSSSVQGERADEFGFSREADDLPDILVMTPEACLLLIHMEASAFENVGLLVFDEYQLIHPSTDVDRRSIDAMLCIINFIRVAPNADLVLLSAMVKNTDEIVAWITELTGRSALELSMAWKPTRQMRGCVVYDQSRINKLNNKLRAAKETATTRNVPVEIKRQMTAQPFGFFSVQQTWASQKRQDYVYLPFYASPLQLATNSNWRLTPNAGVVAAALATAAAEADIKTLIFSQSIPNAVSNAKKAACAIEACEVDLTEHEKRWFAIAVDELGGADQLYIDVHEGKLVSQAASHHGQLLPEERYLVESLYKRPGGVKVLAATPTLGQGVNMPSELVIIAEDSRFNEETGRRTVLEAQELLNAAGRAGRAGQNATGIVVVVPGQIVGFDNAESQIGPRWSRLRGIFSQSDQCLILDDPFTALMDRIHASTDDLGDLERYAVSRLLETGEDKEEKTEVGLALGRTFAAFRKRQEGNHEWVQSRTQAALALLKEEGTGTDEDRAIRDLSSTLGFPEEVVAILRTDVLTSPLGVDATVIAWRDWMLHWLNSHPDEMMRLIRIDDLTSLFGSKFSKLQTNRKRADYASPYLELALDLWMSGEPLKQIQAILPGSTRDRKKSTSARKFVLRLLPALAHVFGSPFMISRQQMKTSADTSEEPCPALLQLNRCIRRGFSSVEMAAFYDLVRTHRLSRREVHREFDRLQPYIPKPMNPESWAGVRDRIETASINELNRRGDS